MRRGEGNFHTVLTLPKLTNKWLVLINNIEKSAFVNTYGPQIKHI